MLPEHYFTSSIRAFFKSPSNYKSTVVKDLFNTITGFILNKKKLQYCNSVETFIMALITTIRFKKSSWLKCYYYHYLLLKNPSTNTLLLGDSMITGFSRYLKVSQRYVTPLNMLNSGIEGDQVVNVLWGAINLLIPPMENAVILLGTNIISTDTPADTVRIRLSYMKNTIVL